MKHMTEGEIQAYLDGEYSTAQRQETGSHLETCQRCRSQLEKIKSNATRLRSRLTSLDPQSTQEATSASAARARLALQLSKSNKENENMWKTLFSRIPRPVWVTLAVVAVLAIALTFEPVRAVANSFLGLFRVEQIKVVQIDPANLENNFGSSYQFEQVFSQNVQVEERGEPQEVSNAEEASQLAGFEVRLPTKVTGEQSLEFIPGGSATFNIDLDLVQAVLDESGYSDIKLPKDLDGAKMELDIPAGVVAQYGDCGFAKEEAESFDPDNPHPVRVDSDFQCTSLMQISSPTISAPPGLDLARIGAAYLQILGMSQQEAENFASNVDWATTFVVPIPRYGTEYEQVQVDGVDASLILHEGRQMYVLMWVKDGIVYALSGPGDAEKALKIAESMQ